MGSFTTWLGNKTSGVHFQFYFTEEKTKMCVPPEALNFSGAPEVLKAVLKSDIKWLLKNRPQPLKCMRLCPFLCSFSTLFFSLSD